MSQPLRPADLTPLARDVMKMPASIGLIFFSFVAAYLLMVLPWSGAWLASRPDFLLLVLLFWSLHQPRSIGQGIAFFAGLLMDVSDSMLLGQHALAYVIAMFGAQVFRVRILTFPIPEQTLHILGLTLVSGCVMLVLNLLLGADFPGFAFFVSPVVTAILWGPVNWILYLPAVRRRRGATS
jgi:rod shape-determining protein MreD